MTAHLYITPYRGKAILGPSGNSGGIPAIELRADDQKKTHNTPEYEQVTEVKFKYKGKENEDPKLPCPPINLSKNDREAVKRLIDDNVRHLQQRPAGKEVTKVVQLE